MVSRRLRSRKGRELAGSRGPGGRPPTRVGMTGLKGEATSKSWTSAPAAAACLGREWASMSMLVVGDPRGRGCSAS